MKKTDRDAANFSHTGLDAQSDGGISSEAGKYNACFDIRRPIARIVIVLTTLLAGGTTAHAQELRELTAQQEVVPVANVAEPDFRRGLAIDAASIGDTDGVTLSGYVPPAPCRCTNTNDVSVICEECDKATDGNQCFTHDRACQDAAQAGGIREHKTFFCTMPIDNY